MARRRYRRRRNHRRRIRRHFLGLGHCLLRPAGPVRRRDPGFEGLLNGFWLFAGPLAAIIVRKPGAALFAETLAAFLELTLGNQWGVGGSLIVGIIQGLGAEIATPQFQGEFTGKKTLENGEVVLGVVKNGKVEKPNYQVDGISGGTITSVGVDAMLKACLSSYKNFLTNNNEEE